MNLSSQSDKVKAFFPELHLGAVKTFLILAFAIHESRTVCLYKAADKTQNAKNDAPFHSSYTRLIRWFKTVEKDKFLNSILNLTLQSMRSGRLVLTIDRTNWKLGGKNINVLAIGYITDYQVFIPLVWIELDKKGNSSQEERNQLLQKLASFDFKGTNAVLVGDREFIGTDWFEKLIEMGIQPCVRLREKDYRAELAKTQKTTVDKVRLDILRTLNRKPFYCKEIVLNEKSYSFIAFENSRPDPNDPYVYLLTTLTDPKEAADLYRLRWKIEVFFKSLKTNGYNLEDLNLKDPDKIELMVGVLAYVYQIAIENGAIEEKRKPEKPKKYANNLTYPSKSTFRRGISHTQLHYFENNYQNFLIFAYAFFEKNE